MQVERVPSLRAADLMAKRSKKKKAVSETAAARTLPREAPGFVEAIPSQSMGWADIWAPLGLALATFLIYLPSLSSDFVYDARMEILEEGFITSLANLPDVLSLKVLGMNLMLADRPGQLLYMMLIGAVSGENPWGYHLGSNLLHAANVALLYALLLRLVSAEIKMPDRPEALKIRLAVGAVTLIFALHPMAVESVAEVSYSSAPLVTLFTLLALLAATAFRPENSRAGWVAAVSGTFFILAAVASKESGVAASMLVIVYWFLFRRKDSRGPWLYFLGAVMAATAAFLAARFLLAPPGRDVYRYVGGSFSEAFLVQPRAWVFMMGKLLWPVGLSADYTLENIDGISTTLALGILAVVVLAQAWVAWKSRIGALGFACYWLGLATVSNFVPIHRFLADRFYYLPLTGVAMQLLALLLMTLGSRSGFWIALGICAVGIMPLTALTLIRQDVFTNEFTLWSDTVHASPFSSIAHNDLGNQFRLQGREDEARTEFQKAVDIDPDYFKAQNNLANILFQLGHGAEAIGHYQKALEINPAFVEAMVNLGIVLSKQGKLDEAIVQYQKALEIRPDNVNARNNLAIALWQKGRLGEAVAQFEEVLRERPDDIEVMNNLAKARQALHGK
jgi:tetratricopeptide (TPR) repeat protein